MPHHVTVGTVADRFNVPPTLISELFYRRILDVTRCKIVGGRRLIPTDYVEEIGRVLAARGRLPAERDSVASA